MITYADGTVAQLGDHVDHDGTPAIVVEIIDTAEARTRCGLGKDGLMFDWGSFGIVFEAADAIQSDPTIVFLKRAD